MINATSLIEFVMAVFQAAKMSEEAAYLDIGVLMIGKRKEMIFARSV